MQVQPRPSSSMAGATKVRAAARQKGSHLPQPLLLPAAGAVDQGAARLAPRLLLLPVRQPRVRQAGSRI